MADIFISYKREDLQLAALVAKHLTDEGWQVWWDRNIPIGKAFDQVIEEELARAKCVVVLWTSLSVASLNVKEEASEGLRRNILIPVKTGDILPPYGFRMIQTLSWKEVPDEDEIDRLINEIKRLTGNPPGKTTLVDDRMQPDNTIANTEPIKPTITEVKPATLRFIRKYNWIGAALSFTIYIDGEKAGKLSVNDTLEMTVDPGLHHIRVTGGGTFAAAENRVQVKPAEIILWEVGYSLTGGAKLSRVQG